MSAITHILALGPQTVKTLAERAGLSESRVRELLKKEPGVKSEKNGTAPATFWTEAVDPVAQMLGEGEGPTCPLCGSKAEQKPAGEEGSFLGGCATCSSCGETYNVATGKHLPVDPTKKAKRKLMNPQYKIDAKVKAVQENGGTLSFDKASRQWMMTKADGRVFRFTAKQFADHTPETLVAFNG